MACQEVTEFRRFKPEMRSKVLVGRDILSKLDEKALDIVPALCHKSQNYLITDTIVDGLFGEEVLGKLRAAGLLVEKLVMPADSMDKSGESSAEHHKTLAVFSDLVDQILAKGLDKRSCVISLGGGVVNNVCGFIAGTLYRGITLVHIPTTMMAQCDAAIDFKQAVNHPRGKNLIGCYHAASVIACDPTVMTKQSRRHLLNGLSECIKHAITQSGELLTAIVEGASRLQEVDYLEHVIRETVLHKSPTLTNYDSSDFNEMCPQYGHSIGHAIEHLSWSPKFGAPLLHGEAIAIGMCVSAEIALLMGVCEESVVTEHYEAFEAVGLPCCLPAEMDVSEVLRQIVYDKHFVSKRPTMGLAVRMGEMYCVEGSYGHSIDPEVLEAALRVNMAKRGELDDSLGSRQSGTSESTDRSASESESENNA